MSELTEEEFLDRYSPDKYRKPALTVDMVIFTVREQRLQVLLIERGNHPFKGCMAIPGGFLDPQQDASLLAAARRELKEETDVDAPYLEQFGAYGSRDRDPRDWVATVAYFALLPAHLVKPIAGDDAKSVHWVSVQGDGVGCSLAFDHKDILRDAIGRLRFKLEYTPIAAYLLPQAFTLDELQRLYELILEETFSKKAFQRRVVTAGIVEEVTGKRARKKLYRLRPDRKIPPFFLRIKSSHVANRVQQVPRRA